MMICSYLTETVEKKKLSIQNYLDVSLTSKVTVQDPVTVAWISTAVIAIFQDKSNEKYSFKTSLL
jgi:hypothetical protein